MKKWMYLIFPTIGLALFLVFYFSHKEKAEAKEREHVALVARQKSEADEKKRVAEAKAREDAKKRQDERDAEEKKKEDEKKARQDADDKKVRDQTAEFTAKVDSVGKQVAGLEAELNRLRNEKEKTSRESFDIAKQVELTRIARRTAELEIQRLTEMVTRRAAESSMTRPPPMPAAMPAAAKKT